MEITGSSTAIMLAVAAGLWLLYLVPGWRRHREDVEAERAERHRLTVGVESAGVWRTETESPVAMTAPAAVGTPAESARPALPRSTPEERLALLKVRQRRTRRLAAGLLLASAAALVIQAFVLTTTAATVVSWVILVAAAGGVVVSIGVQRRLDVQAAARGIAPSRGRRGARTSTPLQDIDLGEVAARGDDWTPIPVPKPLYLARDEAARQAEVQPVAVPQTELRAAEIRMRAAAELSEERLRAAHAEPEVAEFRPATRRRESAPSEVAAGLRAAPEVATTIDSAEPAATERARDSRWARMGMLDDGALGGTDLDDVLARRRRVG